MNWVKLKINGTIKPILCILAAGVAFGMARAQLNAIQETVNLSATQKSVDDLREAITDRVERLEDLHLEKLK